MAEKGRKGKVIEFTPRKRPRLKKLDYVDPAQKELRDRRLRQRQKWSVRDKTVRNVGIFIGLSILVFLLRELFK